jgi:hypothetical protein
MVCFGFCLCFGSSKSVDEIWSLRFCVAAGMTTIAIERIFVLVGFYTGTTRTRTNHDIITFDKNTPSIDDHYVLRTTALGHTLPCYEA